MSKLSINKNILILLLLFSHFMHICLQIWAAWCFGHRSHCRQATKLSDSLDHNTWLEDNACIPHGLHRPLHHLNIVVKIEFDCTSLPESNKAIMYANPWISVLTDSVGSCSCLKNFVWSLKNKQGVTINKYCYDIFRIHKLTSIWWPRDCLSFDFLIVWLHNE